MTQPLQLSTLPGQPQHTARTPAAASREFAQLSSALDEARDACRSMEDEKERLADRQQALMDALPAAVLVLDGAGRVQECNPAAEELLAMPLQGELWRDMIQRLFLPHQASSDELLLHNGRFVTLSTQPLGSYPGQVLLLQDVTEKHRLQSHLEHHRRLADMGRMAASLAHQIRTPLSSAMLYLSQLASPNLAAEIRERFTGKALESLKGLEKLITDMLLFANGGKGHLEPVLPAMLLRELQEEMGDSLQTKGITLECAEPVDDNHTVLVNRTLLKSALQNLLVNAAQATENAQPHGRIELAVSVEDEWLEIAVADNGPGIAPTEQARIFEPFVSGRAGGTGLGLAVVRAVARALGGEVSLESATGLGSRFAVRLPAHKHPRAGVAAVAASR